MLSRNGWRIEESNGLRFYCLARPGEGIGQEIFVQGVFTRQGGASQGPWKGLNVGHTVGDDQLAVETNHDLICQALGTSREAITTAHQVHGAHVHRVTSEDRGMICPATDGLITDAPGIALMLRFADCVPLLLCDPRHRAVGLVHAGWRGTLAGIATRTVGSMQQAFNSVPEELVVGIGPAIGPCCYEIGWDLADRVRDQFPQWPELIRWQRADSRSDTSGPIPYLDLWVANRRQLEAVGVHSIAVANRCTACHEDEFYSHRSASLASRGAPIGAVSNAGRTGRFAAVIGLRAA